MRGAPGVRPAASSRRQAWAWLSFAACMLLFLSVGAVLLLRDLPICLGFDIDRPLSGWESAGAIMLVLAVLTALAYVAGVCWLLLARVFLTRAEVVRIVRYGPTTGLERWLVEQLFPPDAQG